MENVAIWYSTDNEKGEMLAAGINGLGLNVNLVRGFNIKDANIMEHAINIFIFDLIKADPKGIIEKINKDKRIQSYIKFVFLKSSEIKSLSSVSINTLHLEFLSRPVNKREFSLLLEKTIVVERYREIMKTVSKESESRIEAFEGLIDINRKEVFDSEKGKKIFEDIVKYEKNLLRQQSLLNEAIKGFTMLRQSEMFDLRNRIRAEELLADLRRKELMDSQSVIAAQESVIDFAARQLDDTQKMLKATEHVAELSRTEQIQLYDDLKRQMELNKSLAEEVERLLKEVDSLKKKNKG